MNHSYSCRAKANSAKDPYQQLSILKGEFALGKRRDFILYVTNNTWMGHFLSVVFVLYLGAVSTFECQQHNYTSYIDTVVGDQSLITGRGCTKWENGRTETFCGPLEDRVKLSAPPLLKGGQFLCPPPLTGIFLGLRHAGLAPLNLKWPIESNTKGPFPN